MQTFKLTSPYDIVTGVAERLKRRRIDANLTQRELATRSGVPYASLRLIEDRGKGSFEAVVKIAFALDAEAEFQDLFPPRTPKTIDEILAPVQQKKRVRKS